MNLVTALLTNGAYGYPMGAVRRRKATILACLHQTANTATAMQERNYANRAHSTGPSATAYIDRDGSIVRAILPGKHAAWSQGDVDHPDLAIPTVKAAVASGVNVNEWVYESLEVCGRGAEPFSAQQFEAVAQLVAAASRATGIKVNRSTVVKGESYKVEVYEKAIGLAFKHVAVSSTLKAGTVAAATRPETEGGDVLAEARIKREREQAALRFARDRDLGRLEATMARLDAEAAAAIVRPSLIPTLTDVRTYLASLPDLWAKTSDAGRHAIAEAVFERIDVLGVTDYTFTLTAYAKAHGCDAAFGAGNQSISIGRSGRGERSRPSATRQIRGCAVSMGGRQGPVDLILTA